MGVWYKSIKNPKLITKNNPFTGLLWICDGRKTVAFIVIDKRDDQSSVNNLEFEGELLCDYRWDKLTA